VVRHTFRFDLPLWEVGLNRFEIISETSSGPFARIERRSEARVLFHLPSETWGIDGTAFRLPQIPIRASNCRFVFCKDADQDRLLDLWENIATEVLRPIYAHDVAEPLFQNPSHHLVTFSRITPFRSADGADHIVFFHVATYSKDYGYDPTLFHP